MHLSPIALAMAAPELAPSPSKKNPALVKVGPGRIYRYDPYRCPATASPAAGQSHRSPTKNMLHSYAASAAADRLAGEVSSQATRTPSPAPFDGFATDAPNSLNSTGNHSSAQESLSGASSTTQAPGSSVARFALVSFKHEACLFRAPFRLAPGDCVVVEADRGEHVGIVEEITTERPKRAITSKVLRHAKPAEIDMAAELLQREAALTPKVQRMAESVGLGIKVVDTEFQFDMNKLTIFYSAKNFVDFRKLQRQLFRQHRCRIWLVNWDEVRPYTSPFPRPQ